MIAIESVYSMDGHSAPLVEICDIAEEFGASVIVDEAHGTGAYGKGGRGLVNELGVEKRIFCAVHTYGKAMGVHGACVVGPMVLRQYLINYARPFVFSTSLPLHSLVSIQEAYKHMDEVASQRQTQLRMLIKRFVEGLHRDLPKDTEILTSESPIQGVIIPGAARVVEFSKKLKEGSGFLVLPVRSPTVPKGKERLRIILHSHNTVEEIDKFIAALADQLKET